MNIFEDFLEKMTLPPFGTALVTRMYDYSNQNNNLRQSSLQLQIVLFLDICLECCNILDST